MSIPETISVEGGWSEFLDAPFFSKLDRRFADFIASSTSDPNSLLRAAATLVSYQLNRGHVFLDLAAPPLWDEDSEMPPWPEVETWLEALRQSPAIGAPGDSTPLIVAESGKIYLQRYWSYEKLLATKLHDFAETEIGAAAEIDEAKLDALFQDAEEQKEAARKTLTRTFSIISGGPGTGKTTTVLKILLLLLEQNEMATIRLTAPTGKAAARLQESIRGGLARIESDAHLREKIEQLEASTIHRLLGSVGDSVYFRHNAQNPLVADVIVLDEASMVDLPLMAKLFKALPPHCRLIMLGDKDQLASVEAGSVFTGIVEAATGENPPLKNVATLLKKNFRFGNESGIFQVCNYVREGDGIGALEIFRSEATDSVWRELPAVEQLKDELRPSVLKGFRKIFEANDPAAALDAFGEFQILTALRRGPYGKEGINRWVEEILREESWIPAGKRNYSGLPLMVTENDYSLRLFNGDIGILFEDEDGKLMSYFRSEDGSIRKISPLRLPFAEPAYAMTVHKSQGSEFDRVLIILPARETRILTRELIYTAISRARSEAEVWSTEEIFKAAVTQKVSRGSALAEMLKLEFVKERK